MTRHDTAGPVCAILAVLLGTTAVAPLQAQDPRDAQVASAFKEFDPIRRQQILVPVLDPTVGPPRGAWSIAVQLLAQTLIEEGKDSTAAAWLRWAIRLSPGLEADTVLFLPQVIAAHRTAQTFVRRTRDAADSVVRTNWRWPAQATDDGTGRLEVEGSGGGGVQARGVGPIAAGGSVSLSPGSYQIGPVTSGVDTVWVTREVLPGITTMLAFPAPRAATQLATKPSRHRKSFPVMWVGLAVVGAAGIVALMAANPPGSPAETGGIIVTFPNP